MAPSAQILQDPTKALVLATELQNGGSPVPNGTLTFRSGNDSSVLATVSVTNPNGVETKIVGYAFLDMATSDSVGSIWNNQNVTASYSIGGVTVGPSVGVYNLNDAWDAEEGSWGTYLDPDGHSVWVAPYSYDNFGGMQKYDLNTKTLTSIWGFPFNPSGSFGATAMRAFEDGTSVFWQDNASNFYVLSQPLNSTDAPVSTNRIHKMNPSTFAEIAGFGYDDQYPSGWDLTNHPINSVYTPTDWALYTRSGTDYLATSCDENTGGPATSLGQIINLNTLGITALFVPEVDFSSPALGCHAVWVDKFGVVWWACSTSGGGTTSLYLITWDPANGTSGTYPLPYPQQPRVMSPTLVWTIPGASWQSSLSTGNFAFCYYDAASHSIIFANFTNSGSGPNTGNGSDLGIIDLSTGNVTNFINGTTSDPPPAYSGTVDVIDSCMRVKKASPWSTNTMLAIETCPVTTLSGNFQDGGVINIFDTSLTLQATYNLTRICESTAGVTGGGYTYRGVWSSGVNYAPKDLVTGSDGAIYMAKVFTGPSGVDAGALDPSARSSGRPVNGYQWTGVPVEIQHFGTSIAGGPRQAYAPHGTLLFVQSQNAAVFAHEFVGGPLMLVTGLTTSKPVPVVAITSSEDPSFFEDQVTFSISVTGGGPVPTGSVVFSDAADPGGNFGGPYTLPLDIHGDAQLIINTMNPSVTPAYHTLTAAYLGDSTYATASHQFIQQVIDVEEPTSIVPGFALIGNFLSSGDEVLAPTAQLSVVPPSAPAHTSLILLWTVSNIPKIRITAPPSFDTGVLTTNGAGAFVVGAGVAITTTFTLEGLQADGVTPIGVSSSATATVV